MPAALLHRFTRADYHRMAEVGLFRPDARLELLNGQIIDMLPIGPFHGGIINRLNRMLEAQNNGRWITSVQNSIRLGEHNEPQPDFALLRPRDDWYLEELPGPADIFLLIEVADSSLLFDRVDKAPAYADAGIAELWIVNLPRKCIEVSRDPQAGKYRETFEVPRGKPLAPLAFPDVAIDTAALLK